MSELFKRTKTLATIGPATDSEEMIDKLIAVGLDNCRLNFSHGSYEKMDEESILNLLSFYRYGHQRDIGMKQ